jgi:hypothetical protein
MTLLTDIALLLVLAPVRSSYSSRRRQVNVDLARETICFTILREHGAREQMPFTMTALHTVQTTSKWSLAIRARAARTALFGPS